jgi:crotonobetainyl-CoA:carnitine CoA-transferase CaiB-like acyl-CoA transferase
VLGIVSGFLASKTKAELFETSLKRGLLIAPIATVSEVLASPQLKSRDYWQTVEHPELGRSFTYPGPFAKFSAAPISYRRRPPLPGEHNQEIYAGELGLSAQEIRDLERRGII